MRLYHLDLKFSMYKIIYLESWFRRLKDNGFDGIVVEIDNRLRFPSHPDFAAPDALDPEEWFGLVRYAKNLGMIIYPMIQTLGHMEHVLAASTKYHHLAEIPGSPYLLCPSKAASREFAKDLIRDVCAVFDQPKRIHLGGDECRSLGSCPVCYSRPREDMLRDYLGRLAEFSLRMGMKPEFWADTFLGNPGILEGFPREVRLIDRQYTRHTYLSDQVGTIWGAPEFSNKPVGFARMHIPDRHRPLEKFMFTENDEFDTLYSLDFLKSKGIEVGIASAARCSGDSYALPLTICHLDNVGFSHVVCDEQGCDHLLTSWAVGLAHPETTWPSLVSRCINQSSHPEMVTAMIGGFDSDLLKDADIAAQPIQGIDLLDEAVARFEMPCYGGFVESIRDIHESESRKQLYDSLDARFTASNRLQMALEDNIACRMGSPGPLKHWLIGARLCGLRARQTMMVLDTYSGNLSVVALKPLIDENRALMEDFTSIWKESVTPYSLNREREVKFWRDIRALEDLTTK